MSPSASRCLAWLRMPVSPWTGTRGSRASKAVQLRELRLSVPVPGVFRRLSTRVVFFTISPKQRHAPYTQQDVLGEEVGSVSLLDKTKEAGMLQVEPPTNTKQVSEAVGLFCRPVLPPWLFFPLLSCCLDSRCCWVRALCRQPPPQIRRRSELLLTR